MNSVEDCMKASDKASDIYWSYLIVTSGDLDNTESIDAFLQLKDYYAEISNTEIYQYLSIANKYMLTQNNFYHVYHLAKAIMAAQIYDWPNYRLAINLYVHLLNKFHSVSKSIRNLLLEGNAGEILNITQNGNVYPSIRFTHKFINLVKKETYLLSLFTNYNNERKFTDVHAHSLRGTLSEYALLMYIYQLSPNAIKDIENYNFVRDTLCWTSSEFDLRNITNDKTISVKSSASSSKTSFGRILINSRDGKYISSDLHAQIIEVSQPQLLGITISKKEDFTNNIYVISGIVDEDSLENKIISSNGRFYYDCPPAINISDILSNKFL